MRSHHFSVWIVTSAVVCLFSLNTFSNPVVADQPALHVSTEAVGMASNFDAVATPSSGASLHLTFALTSAAASGISDYVNSLTDPKSANYHKWLTPEQFGEKFGANQDDVKAVTAYLTGLGLTDVKVWPDKLFVSADATVKQAETAFSLSIKGYDRSLNEVARGYSSTYYAPDQNPTIQKSVAGRLTGIFGLSSAVERIPSDPVIKSNPMVSSQGYLDPTDFAKVYDTSSLHALGLEGQGETIAIFSPTAFQQSDITRFLAANNITSANINVVNVNGGNTNLAYQTEACIDIETAIGQAPAATINVYEGPNDGSFNIFLKVEADDPNILSESYRIDENEVSGGYAQAYEMIRQAMAAEGITIFVASGDNGAYDSVNQTKITSSVDAASNYVTAVGGTELSLNNGGWGGEAAWSYKDGTTGGNTGTAGGLSIYYPQQSWQAGPGVQNSNSNGMRQVPDVSALASRPYYDISTGGSWSGWAGTSCSTPLWAGSMALVEEGLGTRLGVINPTLYSVATKNPGVFHDITSGNNGAYTCTPGWDYVTGLGSVDFGLLYSALQSGFSLSATSTSLSVPEGSNASTTVGITPNGSFANPVALTATGLPNGVTAAFNPSSISPGATTAVTFAAGPTAAAGTTAVTITGTSGSSTGSITVNLTVVSDQILTTIAVSPGSAALALNGTQQFSATANDQFGNAIASRPTITWSIGAGLGSIGQSGIYTASATAGNATVLASSGQITGSSAITVAAQPPTVAVASSASPSTVTGTSTNLSVLGADDLGAANLTYTWATTGTPPTAVTFSANGTNAAQNTTASFRSAGSYTLQVTITDSQGLSITSSVSVTAIQTPSQTTVTPSTATLVCGNTQSFAATVLDQFGNPLSAQPSVTWAVTGGGTINSASGLFTSTTVGGPFTITATAANVQGTAAVMVTPNVPGAPTIASFTPASGPIGTVIAVTGTGFTGTSAASVDGLPAEFTVVSNTLEDVTVPSGAATGAIHIRTALGLGVGSSNFIVTSTAPIITSFTPASGPVGTVITVNGSGFTGSTAASVDGFVASYTVVSDSVVQVTVPSGAATGSIHVRNSLGVGSSPSNFTVTAAIPTITSCTPASGSVGTVITVIGTNFANTTAASVDGVVAGYVVESPTEVLITVPSGASSGSIHVRNPDGVAYSPANFTVTTAVPSISSFTPSPSSVGNVITVMGSGFSGTTAASINGVPAQFTVVSDTVESLTVPSGASTGAIHIRSAAGLGVSSIDLAIR
jgi:hypothetical protein